MADSVVVRGAGRTDPASKYPEIYYPESDGKPMGETDFHISALLYLRQALRYFFRNAPGVYVAADMLFYYEEGNPAAYKVPDVFVVKGIDTHDRRIYRLWVEGVAPCVVFEITSRSTRLEDLGTKRALYEMLGVNEYFLFDPLDEYLRPRLQGFRLAQGFYQPVVPSADGTITSHELDLLLRPDDRILRLVDPIGGTPLPTLDEAVGLMAAAMQRADAEAQRADAEAQRAETEARRADAAEQEQARLQAELQQLRREFGSK